MKTVIFKAKVKKPEDRLPNKLFQRDEEGRNSMPKRGKSALSEELRKYKITNELLYKWFGYSNADSFIHSNGKYDIISGVEELIQHIEN